MEGLLSEKVFKYKGYIINKTDLNSIKKSGWYYYNGYETEIINSPSTFRDYGILEVHGTLESGRDNILTQKITLRNGDCAIRGWSSSLGKWSDWKKSEFKITQIISDLNLLDDYTAQNTLPNIMLCGSSMQKPVPEGLDSSCATSFGVIVLPIHGDKKVTAQILINFKGSIFTRIYNDTEPYTWTTWQKINI